MAALSSGRRRAPVEARRATSAPTPLGNLRDMTPRALDALAAADTVCAEDTRVTGKLLAAFGIPRPLGAARRGEHRREGAGRGRPRRRRRDDRLLQRCGHAGRVRPGQRLIAVARGAAGVVVVLPGPTATATAYVAERLHASPASTSAVSSRAGGRTGSHPGLARFSRRRARLLREPPPRGAALAAIARAFPQRRVALCRELTKVHEEVIVEAAPDLARMIAARTGAHEMRGSARS